MKVPMDAVLKPLPASEDMDPVSENVAAVMGTPLYVLPAQEHVAHMMVHLAFIRSPLFGGNPAVVKDCLYPLSLHLRDHLLNYYLVESHTTIQEAQKSNMIRSEAADEVPLLDQVLQHLEQTLDSGPAPFSKELAQIDQEAQKYKPQAPMPPDSSLQVAQLSAQLQTQMLQQKTQHEQQQLQLDTQKMQLQGQMEQQKIAVAQAKVDATKQIAEDKLNTMGEEHAQALQVEQLKQDADNRRAAAEIASKERINFEDNQTAKAIAAEEIASGERTAVKTGTGINPNPSK